MRVRIRVQMSSVTGVFGDNQLLLSDCDWIRDRGGILRTFLHITEYSLLDLCMIRDIITPLFHTCLFVICSEVERKYLRIPFSCDSFVGFLKEVSQGTRRARRKSVT